MPDDNIKKFPESDRLKKQLDKSALSKIAEERFPDIKETITQKTTKDSFMHFHIDGHMSDRCILCIIGSFFSFLAFCFYLSSI